MQPAQRRADAEARVRLGDGEREAGRSWMALHHYESAVATDPEFFDALLRLGEGLAHVGALNPAHGALARAVTLRPRDPLALAALGRLASRKRLTDLAVDSFRTAVEVAPEGARSDARSRLGDALKRRGDADEAIDCYVVALSENPKHFDALRGLANDRRDRGLVEEATLLYLRALDARPTSAELRNDYGVLLRAQGRRGEALEQFRRAAGLKPNYVDAYVNLGSTFEELGAQSEAEAYYRTALRADPTSVVVHCHLARLALRAEDFAEAERLFLTAAKLDPSSSDAICGSVHCARILCDWKDYDRASVAVGRATRAQLEAGLVPSLPPDQTALYPMSHERRKEIAARRAGQNVSKNTKVGIVRNYTFPLKLVSRIRVGYACSDFDECPGRSVPGLHDRSEFEVFCYALSPKDRGGAARTLAEHFVDLSALSDVQAADRIKADEIVALVDLNGHAEGARSAIFALRPAPIQATWLGSPGTSGAVYVDYLICDEVVCPPRLEDLYSEKLARLPGSCFVGDNADSFSHVRRRAFLTDASVESIGTPSDGALVVNAVDFSTPSLSDRIVERPIDASARRRTTATALELSSLSPVRKMLKLNTVKARLPCGVVFMNGLATDTCDDQGVPREILVTARSQYGLADDAVVYANFNRPHKLDPQTFALWAEILGAVPNSKLWLLKFTPGGETNLRKEAADLGLAEDRLVFSDVVDREQHARRCQLADVCLDTLLCNGRSTNADVLWAGTPVVALPGETFASRVTASQLTALGCPELIASSRDEYRDLAVRLGTDGRHLRAIRAKVWNNCAESSLFDCRRFARGLEKLYGLMWEKFQTKRGPSHITVCSVESNDDDDAI